MIFNKLLVLPRSPNTLKTLCGYCNSFRVRNNNLIVITKNSSLKIKPKQQIINRYFSSKSLLFSSEPLNQNLLIQKKKIPRGKEKSSNVDTLSPQTKKVLKSLGILSAGFGVIFTIYLGRPFTNDREDQYKDLNAFQAWYMRLQARTNDITHFFTEPSSDKLLPDRDTIPNLPPLTLVINLDQTLIYSTWDRKNGWRTAKRPGVDYFLYAASNLFEVVIFTSQPSYVAEQILAKLDPLGMVPFRLFRESTRYVEGKDISKINRDLSKVIVMDSNPVAYSMQPENVITVPPWTGDPNDTYLVDIITFLEGISLLLSEVQDIRPVVKEFQGKNVTKFYPEWEEQWKNKHHQEWEKAKPKKEGLARFVSMIGGSQVHEQVMPQYQQALIHRQMVHGELLEHYKSIKDRGPELQRAIDDYEKKIQESMKEQKITHWDLLTKVGNQKFEAKCVQGEQESRTEMSITIRDIYGGCVKGFKQSFKEERHSCLNLVLIVKFHISFEIEWSYAANESKSSIHSSNE
ncbi:28508_t:CDS:10 [Dentiscutata erythropus]|uniref:Mitochondrial import inner membrane translocase subunit TIM50 n=1 Tax=Dentiscutata erythropus TaxID=1348616 RepID=A0A9N8VL33_9GLOM|nr:28508_t:CDS:10 [Dentiscutata erythropus]